MTDVIIKHGSGREDLGKLENTQESLEQDGKGKTKTDKSIIDVNDVNDVSCH